MISKRSSEPCQKARATIRNGKLPSRHADRLWGGPGVGAPCTVCNEPVTKSEMEFAVEFAPGVRTPVNLAFSTQEEFPPLRALWKSKLFGIPRLWGGPANGESCDACEEIVPKAMMIIEGLSGDEGGVGVQFHVRSFQVWDSERKTPGHEERAGLALPRASDPWSSARSAVGRWQRSCAIAETNSGPTTRTSVRHARRRTLSPSNRNRKQRRLMTATPTDFGHSLGRRNHARSEW